MSLRDYLYTEITNFRGPWTYLEESDVPVEGARYAQNVEYLPGAVKTRFGFAELLSLGVPVGSLFNWITTPDMVNSSGNYLFYVNTSNGNVSMIYNWSTKTPYSLFTLANMASATWASGATRVYCAPLKSDGTSAGQCRIIGIFGAAVNTDTAFLGTANATITVTEPGSGVVTAGEKRVGFVTLTRNGFFGKISGKTSVTATGGKNLNLQLAPVGLWPTEVSTIYAVMTTTANNNRYYLIPSSATSVISDFTVNVIVDINDADLQAIGMDVTDNDGLWVQDGTTGPFNPTVVLEIGNRIGYIHEYNGISQIAISEPEKPQHLTQDQHVLTLPGFRKLTTGFMMPNGLYLLGPNWTYYTSDNGDKPVLWPVPQLVDGAIGTTAPRGVAANTSRGYAWIASSSGFWYFAGGAYANRPASYLVTDWWNRINWAQSGLIEVVDHPARQKVQIKVPLDSASTANYIFTFDYTDGVTPELIKFSVDSWEDARAFGAVCLGTNPTTQKHELWLSDGAAGSIYREKNDRDDTDPYNDAGALGITAIYETSLMPPKMNAGQIRKHYGAHFRVKGMGQLVLTAKSMGGLKTATPTPIDLVPTPGEEWFRRWQLISEAQSIRMSSSGADNWFMLSALKAYYVNWGTRR
jgi:hypothetical protein